MGPGLMGPGCLWPGTGLDGNASRSSTYLMDLLAGAPFMDPSSFLGVSGWDLGHHLDAHQTTEHGETLCH